MNQQRNTHRVATEDGAMDGGESSTIVLRVGFIARQPSRWKYSSHAVANASQGSTYFFDAIVRSTEMNVGEVLWSRSSTHGSGQVWFIIAKGSTREGIGSGRRGGEGRSWQWSETRDRLSRVSGML